MLDADAVFAADAANIAVAVTVELYPTVLAA